MAARLSAPAPKSGRVHKSASAQSPRVGLSPTDSRLTIDWGPGGWTFCDAARERAIAEGVVARCLGIAADAVPRLAGAVAAAVREATRPPAQTRTAGKAKTGFWPNLPGLGLLT